jgi:hypothetical protein
MDLDNLKSCLLEAVKRYRAMSFDEIAALGEKRVFEERGATGSGFYCQIEVAILDKLIENGVDVLHVPIVARDEENLLSAELFFYANGRVRWNEGIYRYRDGVPELMH